MLRHLRFDQIDRSRATFGNGDDAAGPAPVDTGIVFRRTDLSPFGTSRPSGPGGRD